MCFQEGSKNLITAFIIKSFHFRSPYGETFDIVDKTSVYEDRSISCMCKVIEGIYKSKPLVHVVQIEDYDPSKICGIIIQNVQQKHFGAWT